MWYGGFKPYVRVADRKKLAEAHVQKLAKTGQTCVPIKIDGRAIAKSFWGKAWCDHLEHHSDYANRMPRGRTYVRNGSVIDLQIQEKLVTAQVYGSELYQIKIDFKPLDKAKWNRIKQQCAGQIASVVELLQGKFSDAVMRILTNPTDGMFPSTKEITLDCSCPDWASMCKHVAAALYGVGARLDSQPELLFKLRGVDMTELLAAAGDSLAAPRLPAAGGIGEEDLSAVFGIEIDTPLADVPAPVVPPVSAKAAKPRKKASAAKPRSASKSKTAKRPTSSAKKASTAKTTKPRRTTAARSKRGSRN